MVTPERYTEAVARTWDAWAKAGIEWSIPVTHEAYMAATRGEWGVYLTPCRIVPHAWFDDLQGKALLGLATGGGQQMPIFAALGARCTVMDYSTEQLARERMVAEREGYAIDIVRADMTLRFPFDDAQFDIIFHPVSNVYVEDVYPVWRECARVLRPGGLLLTGLDNGMNFLVKDDKEPLIIANKLPFNPLKNEAHRAVLEAEGGGLQFSHSLEEQIGGQLRAGFTLLDLYEDRDRPGSILREYTPQYYATRAVRQ